MAMNILRVFPGKNGGFAHSFVKIYQRVYSDIPHRFPSDDFHTIGTIKSSTDRKSRKFPMDQALGKLSKTVSSSANQVINETHGNLEMQL